MSSGFAACAVAIWSQQSISWAWSASGSADTRTAVALMSVAVLALGAIAVSVVISLAVLAAAQIRRGAGRRLWLPAGLCLLAAGVLYAGCHYFAPHWPGSGAHPPAGQRLAPAWIAQVGWAGTLWISSYWLHPEALRAFPAGEVAWMALSPLAWAVLLGAGASVLHRLELTPRGYRWLGVMFAVCVAVMVVFLAGTALWLWSAHQPASAGVGVGAIDLAMVGLLTAGLLVAAHLARRALSASLRPLTG